MTNEHNFLITYGLHNFVTFTKDGEKSVFTIRGLEGRKLTRHAKSLIAASFGKAAEIQVA